MACLASGGLGGQRAGHGLRIAHLGAVGGEVLLAGAHAAVVLAVQAGTGGHAVLVDAQATAVAAEVDTVATCGRSGAEVDQQNEVVELVLPGGVDLLHGFLLRCAVAPDKVHVIKILTRSQAS